MQNKLYNILVPVDFTAKNKWAIAKAIEMANNFNCNIHLVHVVFNPIFPFFADRCQPVYALCIAYQHAGMPRKACPAESSL